jgi:hypothetical protein
VKFASKQFALIREIRVKKIRVQSVFHPWLKIQTPNAPNVQRKMILARRSSPRANRKSARSAPVPGRSNIANQAVIETFKAHRRPSLAAAGDGRTPPSIS